MTPGSIISDTTNLEQIIPVVIKEAKRVASVLAQSDDNDDNDASKELLALIEATEERMEADDYYDNGDAETDLEELSDKLTENAPAFLYFGPHENDPADTGYWIDHDAVEEARESGEIVKVNSPEDIQEKKMNGEDSELYATFDRAGNITALYDDESYLIWEV